MPTAQELKFKKDYEQAAIRLSHFLSWKGYGETNGFHQFHVTTPAMKLDRVLGMPWTLKLPAHNKLSFSFAGVARDQRSKSGERRFTSAYATSKQQDLDFDNVARIEAPQRFGLARMHIHMLRDANKPEKRPVRGPNWTPAIDVTDMPSESEMKRRIADAKKRNDESWQERYGQWKFYDNIRNAHDANKVSGTDAFYSDIQQLIQDEIPNIPNDELKAYCKWLDSYLEQKKHGKDDKDILPLMLDFDFPEMPLDPKNKGPAGPRI